MCPRSAVGTVRSSQPESMDRATAGRTTYSVQGKPRTGSASGEDIPAQIRNEQSLEVFPLVPNPLRPTLPTGARSAGAGVVESVVEI